MTFGFSDARGLGTRAGGHPGRGGGLSSTEASTGIHPIAPLSDVGAALFIACHTHTLVLWECRRPHAQTFPSAKSVTA